MIQQTDERQLASTEIESGRVGRQKYSMPWMLEERLRMATDGSRSSQKWTDTLELNNLRLMYMTSHLDDGSANDPNSNDDIGSAQYLDYPIQDSREFYSLLQQTETEVR